MLEKSLKRLLCGVSSVFLFVFCILHPVLCHADNQGTDYSGPVGKMFSVVASMVQENLDALSTDIQNGDLTAESDLAKRRAAMIAIQALGMQQLLDFYYAGEYSYDWTTKTFADPDSSKLDQVITVSGSGVSGLYSVDNVFYVGFINSSFTSPCAYFTSDYFNFRLDFDFPDGYFDYTMQGSFSPSSLSLNFGHSPTSGFYGLSLSDSGGHLSPYYSSFLFSSSDVLCFVSDTSIPSFSSNSLPSSVGTFRSSSYRLIGNISNLTLPNYTVNTSEPWDYYNEAILPYIQNTYNDIDNYTNYIFFPDGYEPENEEPTSDTETPIETTSDTNVSDSPFTLPPEWLEDRVDLETDHYTVPYTDLVQDPWEYIQGQATTTGEETTSEPLRGQFRTETAIETVAPEPTLPGVLHADPAIMTSLWDFENFAQELLSRSGLWAIFAGLTAAGICIRLISLH